MAIDAAADVELKGKHRAKWGNGDYPLMVATFLLPVGQRLVDGAGIGPGVRVLDVAAGTGNASVPAAQRGAHVTASDLTPDLSAAGSRRSDARRDSTSTGSRPMLSSCRSRTVLTTS